MAELHQRELKYLLSFRELNIGKNFCNFQFLEAVASNQYPLIKTSLIDTFVNHEPISLQESIKKKFSLELLGKNGSSSNDYLRSFLSLQNNVAFFILVVHDQRASVRLVSALRRRRRRLLLNRARFQNRPQSRSPRTVESWFELGTMYRISLSFFLSIFLVAACTTCAGFDDSIGKGN